MSAFTNNEIGTGAALAMLVQQYADDCVIAEMAEVHDGEWLVVLDHNSQQIATNVTRRDAPLAAHIRERVATYKAIHAGDDSANGGGGDA